MQREVLSDAQARTKGIHLPCLLETVREQGILRPSTQRGMGGTRPHAWRTDDELRTEFAEETTDFLIQTKRDRNQIVFCSGKCEDAHFDQQVCSNCGGTDGVADFPFPDSDAMPQLPKAMEQLSRPCGSRCLSARRKFCENPTGR